MEKNRILLLIGVIIGVGIFMSCKRNANPASPELLSEVVNLYEKDSFYYCGYFVFASDSSYFEDCATGNRFRLVENALLEDIRARYEEISDPQSIELFGSIKGILHFENEAISPQIEVLKFLGFNQTEGCNPNAVMADVYTVTVPGPANPDLKVTITLSPDYEFVWNEFNYKTHQDKILVGKWGRVNEEDLLLKVSEEDGEMRRKLLTAYFDFPNMQLWVDTIKLHRK